MSKKVIEFKGVEHAVFLARPNRFTAKLSDGRVAHLHDPGRLKELLVPGAEMIIQKNCAKGRKTCYDVLAVKYSGYWVFINSGYHSQMAEQVIPSLFGKIKDREVKFGESRIDFLLDDERPLEVKGCTLLKGKTALFPDAPTSRGTRHVLEITKHKGALLFLVFHPNAEEIKPNRETDPHFYHAVKKAVGSGVEIKAAKFRTIVRNSILRVYFVASIPMILD